MAAYTYKVTVIPNPDFSKFQGAGAPLVASARIEIFKDGARVRDYTESNVPDPSDEVLQKLAMDNIRQFQKMDAIEAKLPLEGGPPAPPDPPTQAELDLQAKRNAIAKGMADRQRHQHLISMGVMAPDDVRAVATVTALLTAFGKDPDLFLK